MQLWLKGAIEWRWRDSGKCDWWRRDSGDRDWWGGGSGDLDWWRRYTEDCYDRDETWMTEETDCWGGDSGDCNWCGGDYSECDWWRWNSWDSDRRKGEQTVTNGEENQQTVTDKGIGRLWLMERRLKRLTHTRNWLTRRWIRRLFCWRRDCDCREGKASGYCNWWGGDSGDGDCNHRQK